ncbi:MAG: GNAT family N-acetyltransferase [Jannaschia sp.]
MATTVIEIMVAGPGDAALLDDCHRGVFDDPPRRDLTESYLADPRLHLVLARDADRVVGMCSGVHYHHPDKPPQMWINELGVAGPWRRRGIATDLVARLSALAAQLSCTEIWVVADPTEMAEGFWSSLGWRRTGDRLAMFTGVPG